MRVLALAVTFLFLPVISLAGPNAGGVLVMHATTLEYTSDVDYAGMSGVACGQDGPSFPAIQECPPYDPIGGADPCIPEAANPTSTMLDDVPHVWYIMAAFPPAAFPLGSCPRLKTMGFRLRYDPTKVAVVANGADDYEISLQLPLPSDVDQSGFPSNRSGMALSFWDARTSRLQEIWWFAGYSYSGAQEATFAVEVLEGEGNGSFVDDSFPSHLDEIAGFGVLGLGGATGYNPAWWATGACCHPDETCTLTVQTACPAGGAWQGANTFCAPNPCTPTPVLLESWAASSLTEGLQIRWEVPLGTTGALYRAWRDPAAGPHDVAPTPDAVPVSAAWVIASADGIVETLDRNARRGTTVRYFLESSAGGEGFIGPVEVRWDPPVPGWMVGPTPFRGTVRLTPPWAGPARAEIFDPAGRLVRTLVRPDGTSPLAWDGRDEADHAAPSGVYTIRGRSSAGEVVVRVVKVR